jgi:NADPH:quinone reductase-like Zn-dependent oxidoreductase
VTVRGDLDSISAEELYRASASRGVTFGSRFRGVTQIFRRSGEVLAAVEVPSELASDSLYRLHPAVLDACFQPLHYALDDEAPLYLPVAVDRLVLGPFEAKRLWSHGRLRAASPDREVRTFDVRIADESGMILAEIDGLRMKRAGELPSRKACLYNVRWRPSDLPRPSPSPDAEWLLVGDEPTFSSSLEAALRERGERARRILGSEAGMAIASARARRIGIVHLGGVATKEASDPLDAFEPIAASLLDLVRALGERPELEARLFLVTRGSQPVTGSTDAPGLAGSMLWGLGATLALETPELRPVRIDLDPKAPAGEARVLGSLLSFDIEDDRIGLRGDRTFVARLAALETAPSSYRLAAPARGDLASLHLEPFTRVRPGRGEVEIEVASTGLNFRDVLMALDLYPGPAGLPGNECAGRIAAVGEGVEGFAPGDAVVAALVPGSFASHVRARASRVVALPERLSFQQGASSPIAFLTARYGLEELARLERGERVLIHAGAGGVGMAAIQIARLHSAEIVATAGSDAKRDRLRSMGIDEVSDSRDANFDAGIRGSVDVVLNSLSGDFIAKSLSLLKTGGRFVEIGKRGIWTEEQVRAVRPDVQYFAFDLEEVFGREPELLRSMLVGVFRDLESGRLSPLPVTAFSIGSAADAFRTMAEGRHVGKIVLDRTGEGIGLDAEARYLVTGGLGAIGLATARWLAAKGARHLVLASRRPPSAAAEAEIESLRGGGIEVSVLAADVTREEDVRRLVARASEGRPLKGVVHAAGVLEDGIFLRQSWTKLLAPLAPKVRGALHLHRATATLPLDFFVSLSSMASVMGSAGQTGYAAANAFLDALAFERRRLGLPGTSVSFGPFEGAGMAAGLDGRDRYPEQGIRKMKAGEALELLDPLLTSGRAHALALEIDWPSYVRTLPGGPGTSLYRELVPSPRRQEPRVKSAETVASRLRSLPAPKRRLEIEARVRRHVLAVLGLSESAALDPQQGFRDAGLDSLMAVEARNRIRADFPDLALASTLCFDYPNLAALTAFLMKALDLEPGPARRDPDSVEKRIEDLSEAEAEALLLEELEGRRS